MSASNIYPSSADLNGSITIQFPIPVRYLDIINTSATKTLSWKFKESQAVDVLEPTEIVTLEDINVYTLILIATNGSYKVLGRG